jgi:hypothetical protein
MSASSEESDSNVTQRCSGPVRSLFGLQAAGALKDENSMASEEHLAILGQGVNVWNRWSAQWMAQVFHHMILLMRHSPEMIMEFGVMGGERLRESSYQNMHSICCSKCHFRHQSNKHI